jgi:hypothetical protein
MLGAVFTVAGFCEELLRLSGRMLNARVTLFGAARSGRVLQPNQSLGEAPFEMFASAQSELRESKCFRIKTHLFRHDIFVKYDLQYSIS